MVPLSMILKKVNAKYEWGNKEYKLNHLLFMDDFKLFSKSEEQMDTLVKTVHVLSTDIGMEPEIKNFGIFTTKRGQVFTCEGMKLPNKGGEVMKEVEKEGYTNLGLAGLDKIKEKEKKKKNNKGI